MFSLSNFVDNMFTSIRFYENNMATTETILVSSWKFEDKFALIWHCVCHSPGTAWGYIESFLFWLLQDLGASRSLMGITITVGGIAGIPLLVLSGPIIDKIGHANVLFIGFIFYAIRLFGKWNLFVARFLLFVQPDHNYK